MPLSLSDLQTEISRDSVRDQLMQFLGDLNFPTEAWQDEDPVRLLVEAVSALTAEQSKTVALLARMVFLDTAEAEFLTNLALSHYQLTRAEAQFASFDVTLTNVGAVTHGPLAAGAIVVKASNGQTFSSQAGATLTAGAATVVAFRADTAGALGNIPGQTLQLVTPFAGVTATFAGAFTTLGVDGESDAALRARCRTRWALLAIETQRAGVEALIRAAAPAITVIGIDADAPRGPGTVDVYCAGDLATAGSGDVSTAQAALDAYFFGNHTSQLVQAAPAPVVVLDLVGTAYVRGIEATAAVAALSDAWNTFVASIPIGGFDLSPGPTHIVQLGQVLNAILDVDGVESFVPASPGLTGDTVVPLNTKCVLGAFSVSVVRLAAAG